MITLESNYLISLNRLGAMNLFSKCGFGVIQIPVRSDCSPWETLVTLFYESGPAQPEKSGDGSRCECEVAIQVHPDAD
jgi:hypothetical protein